jgi:hypothetical protein
LKKSQVITVAQKTMLKDFSSQFLNLMEKFWIPSDSDIYWDELTSESMKLIQNFETTDEKQNSFFLETVATFMKSREALL